MAQAVPPPHSPALLAVPPLALLAVPPLVLLAVPPPLLLAAPPPHSLALGPPDLFPHRCLCGLLHCLVLARWRRLFHLSSHWRWPPDLVHTAAQVWLYGLAGLKNVEIHVAAPGTHGDVVAVLYAAAFANATQVASGLVARGFQKGHDFLGPLLLPLAQHLNASFLQTRRARPPREGLAACWYKQPTWLSMLKSQCGCCRLLPCTQQ